MSVHERNDSRRENGRMVRNARLLTAAALIIVAATAAPVFADPPPPGGGRPPHGMHPMPPVGGFIERHADRIGLDETTTADIRKVVNRARTEDEKLQRQIETAHKQLRIMLESDKPNRKRVMQQADTLGALHIKQRKNRLGAMLDIRAMLTPEQRQELQTIRREMHGRRGGQPHVHGRHHDGTHKHQGDD